MEQTYEELKFAEAVAAVTPHIKLMNDLLSDGRVSLKSQKYRMENNHLTIVSQEKQISEGKTILEEVHKKAASIIDMAQERAKEVESNMKARVAQVNHMEREAKEKLAQADKILWNAEDKKKVKVNG